MAKDRSWPAQGRRAMPRFGLACLALAGLLAGCAGSATRPEWYRGEPLQGPTQRYAAPTDTFRA